ncbi:HAD-like domain-containing protein [Truncatella angustata]|uniref:Mitochondrial import inner membrane translocase subunit TIM50 n=1 Tax=Truncatella angustata TaxID=152316 RepID=A0A9P8UGC1_9PEZI|nr:HAD-like domain-containing protein [Truncatella angustata]KAH6651671.1 HAD-like domain-containing protein [Truncatella angustata]
MLSRTFTRAAQSPALSRAAARSFIAPRISVPVSSMQLRGMAKKSNKPSASQPKPESDSKSSEPIPAPPPSSASEPVEPVPNAGDAVPEAQDGPPKPFNLPDLTQGIPSTLEFEREGATNKSALSDLEEAEAQGASREKGELPASAYISSTEKRRNKWANRMYVSALVLGIGSVAWLGRDWDDDEEGAFPDIPNGWTPNLWWARARARFGGSLSYYHEPAFEKLLPDPDPMFERPYTLCISLEDMLVHSEWTREHGWRIAKRPGADYFLHYLSQYYELVLFTSVPFAMGEPLVRKFDPYRFIVWPLFREATKYEDGEVVKDLSYLNRDLSKVIMVDTNEKHVRNQPENAIILPKWTGDPKDTNLVGLIPFLEYIHTMQYKDVREVLKSFQGKKIPEEFARREAIARAEFEKKFAAHKAKHVSGMGALGSMLGLKPSNMSMMVSAEGEQSPSEAFAQGKMLQDIARERGQRNYELMEEEIRKNGEKWLKEEQQAQENAQAEAMAGMRTSLTGWFGKNE